MEEGRGEGAELKLSPSVSHRRASQRHLQVYSHVEWQLHLGMRQQLRGDGGHFRGQRDPCRGGGGAQVRGGVLETQTNTREKSDSICTSAGWSPDISHYLHIYSG